MGRDNSCYSNGHHDLLQAVQVVTTPTGQHAQVVLHAERERLESVLGDLPPPLYVAGEMVSRELLSDHDVKRLLHCYGAKVTRQAPVSTTTSALRVVGKLGTPVWVLPGLPPGDDVSKVASAESKEGVLCETQAEVKRHTSLLLGQHEYVLLREVVPRGVSLRIRTTSERGLGPTLRVLPLLPGGDDQSEAALLPLFADDAQAVARACVGLDGEPAVIESLATLLGQIAALYWINVSLIGGQIFPIELFGLEFEVCEQGLALLALVPIWLYRGRQGHHMIGHAFLLERFRAKWTPVRVKKTRQNKELEPFSVSMKR